MQCQYRSSVGGDRENATGSQGELTGIAHDDVHADDDHGKGQDVLELPQLMGGTTQGERDETDRDEEDQECSRPGEPGSIPPERAAHTSRSARRPKSPTG